MDLGYCLPSADDEIAKEASKTENTEEDIEKLKALEEAKNGKVGFTFDLRDVNGRFFLVQR